MKTKRLYITMAYTFVGNTGIDIPVSLLEGKSEDEQYAIAYEYAKDHLDEIPVASDAEYVENSDEFDIDDIEMEKFNKEDVKNAIVELKKLQKEHLHLGDRLCHIYSLAIAALERIYPEILLNRNDERKYDLVVFRCKGCVEDLKKEYNPYVYYNGEQIPLNKIEIIKVPYEFCENNETNLDNHWMTSIRLNDCDKKPWLLKTYENANLRNQGNPYYDYYETFNDALTAGNYAVNSYAYDGFEIVLKYKEEGCEEEEVAVYGHFQKSEPHHKGFYQIQ